MVRGFKSRFGPHFELGVDQPNFSAESILSSPGALSSFVALLEGVGSKPVSGFFTNLFYKCLFVLHKRSRSELGVILLDLSTTSNISPWYVLSIDYSEHRVFQRLLFQGLRLDVTTTLIGS